MGWNAGTLIIDDNEIEECVRDHDSEIGIRVDFLNGLVESYYIYPKTPQSASWIPTNAAAGGCDDEEPFNCNINFLGCGLLEMRVSGRVLVKDYAIEFLNSTSLVFWPRTRHSWNIRRGGCRWSGRTVPTPVFLTPIATQRPGF
jgi:hypothetical protein